MYGELNTYQTIQEFKYKTNWKKKFVLNDALLLPTF